MTLPTFKTLLLVFIASASCGNSQILADFQTSMGAFTCQLNYVASPQAVANFIGLAEGSRPWVDQATGSVRVGVPYYNGVIFHRVIAGFMNQSGSRNGLGTDGPGYVFRDEVSNGLSNSTAGVLSMANSGKNTNGAQLFITVAPQLFLDGGYTIFGNVTSGMSVVNAINAVPKSLNSSGELAVPITPVVIQSIAIRRLGAAAQAFDINAQNLPICGGVAGTLKVVPAVSISYVMPAAQPAGTGFQVFRSTNLQSWSKLGEIYQGTGRTGNHEVVFENSSLAAQAFYNIPLIQYPGALGPASTASRTLTVNFGPAYLIYQFNAAGSGGTYQYFNGANLSSGTITYLNFQSGPWSGVWIIYHSGLAPLRITAALDSSTATLIQGRMALDQWTGSNWLSVSTGTFTLSK